MKPPLQLASAPDRHQTAQGYLGVLLSAMPRQTALALGLMLVGSLTEWIGLLLLIPMLALTGLEIGGGSMGRLAEAIGSGFATLGLTPSVPVVLSCYVLVVTARTVLQRLQTLAIFQVQQGFVHHLRQRLYTAIAGARWAYLARSRSSDLMHSLVNQISRIGVMANDALSITAGLLVSLVYLLLALQLSVAMTLLACACGGGLVLLLWKRAARSRDAGEQLTERSRQLMAALNEHLGGIKTAKSYGVEARNMRSFSELSARVVQAQLAAIQSYVWVRAWFQIGSVLLLGVILYIALEVLRLSAAEILLLLFVFSRLVPRFSGIQESYQHFINGLPAFAQVMGLVEACEAEAEPRTGGGGNAAALHEGIRFERVGFSYLAGGETRTIASLDLVIPARRTTAIVGPSGAGKSTVADLLLGLLLPDEGRILVDGVPLAGEQLRAWRERIGYVQQETFLFHDSVRANLLWARPGATEPELREALRLAAADGFVERLPQGLDTVVGDRGVLISGGERQRLALARALLRRPALLILDEATSALDSENEERIRHAIDGLHGEITILVISHRLSTIRGADVIYVLEQGALVESGSWEALLAHGRRFATLCAAQGIEPGGNGRRESAPKVSVG